MKTRALAGGFALALWLSGAAAMAAPVSPTGRQGAIAGSPSLAMLRPLAGVAGDTDNTDIRDVRGPLHIPERWRLWAMGLAALIGTGVVIAGARVYRRRKRRPLGAHERALVRLEEAEALAAAGRPREYAEAASEAVRGYLEERFGIQATVQTTDEFFDAVLRDRTGQLLESIDLLRHFLQACDLAKFSKLLLPKEDMASLNQLARRFVLETWQTAQGAPPSPPNGNDTMGAQAVRTPTAEPTLARQS